MSSLYIRYRAADSSLTFVGNSVALNKAAVTSITGFSLRDTSAAYDVPIVATSSPALNADRTLTINVNDSNRTFSLGGNLTVSANFTTGVHATTFVTSSATNLTLPTVGTLATLDGSEILTGKTMSGASNTFSNIPLATAVTGTLAIGNGGTNSASALNNNRVMRSSGGAIVEAAAITASRALVSDANGIPTHATTTTTEIEYVSGVTSAIQTQLNGKVATTGAETISGVKTFADGIKVDDDTAAGGTTTLNYCRHESLGSFTFQMNNGGATGAVTPLASRVGNLVTLRLGAVVAVADGVDTQFVSTTAIPAWARPASTCFFRVLGRNNNLESADGVLTVGSNGIITIYRVGLAAFTGSQNGGLDSLTYVSYLTA